jgi:spore coat polysaccharide biosynthesis predicted glycosyltransferase SpsG
MLLLEGEPDAEAQAMADGLRQPFDMLVVDHYGRDASLESACRRLAPVIAVLDDMPGHRAHDADILIDGAPGRTASDWLAFAPGATVLAGPDYALIRREIAAARGESLTRLRNVDISRILISFGMSDSSNATVPALRAARVAFPDAQIDVVIGRTAPHAAAVKDEARLQDARVHTSPDNYVDHLVAADLAIGAGGVSAMERACLGCPSVVVETAANQHGGIAALAAQGAIISAGVADGLAAGWPAGLLHGLKARLGDLSARSAAIIDGKGAGRAACALHDFACSRELA